MEDLELAKSADLDDVLDFVNGKRNRRGARPGEKRFRSANRRLARAEDEARWERIFKEKFEDPTYYSRSTIRSAGSSLGGVIGTDLKGASLGTGIATSPPADRWHNVLAAQARAGRAKRELQNGA